jgi:ribosome biogenesis GTPase / thiamine phosphate phosphatase
MEREFIDSVSVSDIRLGWSAERQSQLQALGDPALAAARVSAEHRGAYGLLGGPVDSARLAGRFRQGGSDWPAVGDWVAVQSSSGSGVIQHLLPRTSLLARRRPLAHQAQAVAANIDVVFVVASAQRPPNLRAIERYLTVVWSSGARPVVVLNKSDLSLDPAGDRRALQSITAGVTCIETSAASGEGLDRLRAELASGITGAMVGPSGVGKSSLLNRLLGQELQSTGEVRLTDAKGRHTTTGRELFVLPEAGCLIDTPGMRELGLWDAADGIDQTFEDVEALAAGCRFRDCGHGGEPGCAVAAAVAAGQLGEDRLASLDKLRREEAYEQRQRDPRMNAASKGRWKAIHKQHRARRRVDPKLRDD